MSKKCKSCGAPLEGFFSKIARLAGVRPSAKNPEYCNKCEDKIPENADRGTPARNATHSVAGGQSTEQPAEGGNATEQQAAADVSEEKTEEADEQSTEEEMLEKEPAMESEETEAELPDTAAPSSEDENGVEESVEEDDEEEKKV